MMFDILFWAMAVSGGLIYVMVHLGGVHHDHSSKLVIYFANGLFVVFAASALGLGVIIWGMSK